LTVYGINPSFANWTSRLPLFSDPLRRGKAFEVFKEDGTPTGEPSPLSPDGWPKYDGRWHGVRLFGDMDGTMPEISGWSDTADSKLNINPGKSAFVYWRSDSFALPMTIRRLLTLKPSFHGWHIPSGEAIKYFKPQVLRTLDWGWQARKEKRPDWTKPRVKPSDYLQGEEMALELQIEAANLLGCHLWWNAPPRFELTAQQYEVRLGELLSILKANCSKPPILEYGNELWNAGFPVNGWLDRYAQGMGWPSWICSAAHEINLMHRVADGVFGGVGLLSQKPFYTFVGGHIADMTVLDKTIEALQFTPDLAGPAIYAQPLKSDQEKWKTATDITQDELRASVMANMDWFHNKLWNHASVLNDRHVPHFACYEVGQDMHAHGEAYKLAALEAQRSEWMGDMYRELRKMLDEAGVDLACWYSAASAQTMDRSFGLLESCDLTKALPKARAARGD
jgi:hypothetical protein